MRTESVMPVGNAERQTAGTDAWSDAGEEGSTWELATMIVRHRRVAARVGGAILLIGLAIVAFLGSRRMYTSTASFVPQSGSSRMSGLSGLAGLAAQYGIAVADGQGGENPQFYADLVRSRRVLGNLAVAVYSGVPVEPRTQSSLVRIVAPKETNSALAQEKVISWLAGHVTSSVDKATGVVQLAVSAPSSELARELAERLLSEVQAYDLRTRQSNAGAERRFVEERLARQRADLSAAEAKLEGFLAQNRSFESSPRLKFDYDRLQRDVAERQQVVAALTQAFEQARIEEVRNTPVITIVEQPNAPLHPDPRRRLRNAVLVLALAVILGLAAAFLTAMVQDLKTARSPAFERFAIALQEMKMPGASRRLN